MLLKGFWIAIETAQFPAGERKPAPFKAHLPTLPS